MQEIQQQYLWYFFRLADYTKTLGAIFFIENLEKI